MVYICRSYRRSDECAHPAYESEGLRSLAAVPLPLRSMRCPVAARRCWCCACRICRRCWVVLSWRARVRRRGVESERDCGISSLHARPSASISPPQCHVAARGCKVLYTPLLISCLSRFLFSYSSAMVHRFLGNIVHPEVILPRTNAAPSSTWCTCCVA